MSLGALLGGRQETIFGGERIGRERERGKGTYGRPKWEATYHLTAKGDLAFSKEIINNIGKTGTKPEEGEKW